MDSNINYNVTSVIGPKQKTATSALPFNEMHEMMKSCQRLLNHHGLLTQNSFSDIWTVNIFYWGTKMLHEDDITYVFLLWSFSVPGYS